MAAMETIRNIVILTGAGVSAESGVDTFRDAGGLWEQHRVEDVATPEAFARDPELVLRFYDMRRAAIQTAANAVAVSTTGTPTKTMTSRGLTP